MGHKESCLAGSGGVVEVRVCNSLDSGEGKPGCQCTSVAGEELGHGQVTLQPFPPGQQPPGWCAASGVDHRVLHPTRSVCIGKGFLLL